jgi:hypothetical protein
MTPWDVIEDLYDSEINVGLQADWDGGITVWIGGPRGTPGNEVRGDVDGGSAPAGREIPFESANEPVMSHSPV